MKLGLSGALEHNNAQEWAKKHYDLGCRAINFPLDYTDKDEIIQDYVAQAKEYGLVIAEVGAWCNPLDKDAAKRAEAMHRCKEQLRLADRIGAICCVNISGSKGDKWDAAHKDNFTCETWAEMVASIQEIIDDVNPQQACYSIEPMPWMYPMGPDEYLQLIKDVNRDKFKVHMDIFNWITTPSRYFANEEFMEECFAKLGSYIVSCHLKDVHMAEEMTIKFEEVACGDGEISLEKYVELANQVTMDMPMIIEHLHSDEEYLESLKYIKKRIGDKAIG